MAGIFWKGLRIFIPQKYKELKDLPSINGVKLIGNKTSEDLGISGGGGFTSEIYSLEERIIGVWIDGRPLYQKTIDFGALPNNTTKKVPHGIENLDMIISAFATAKRENSVNYYLLPYINVGFYEGSIAYDANSTYIAIETKTDRTNLTKCYVTLKYVKGE